MHIASLVRIARRIFPVVALVAVEGAASAKSIFVPFTSNANDGSGSQGVWLADIGNLGNPPTQLTNQHLDGPLQSIAVLNDWTYDAVKKEAVNVQPQMVVYGVGGHLFKASLQKISPVASFGSTGYAELCSLTALDERPFAAAKAYVQAIVEPIGSTSNCASGTGTQTWLFPASADGTTAPILEPTNWTVLGAFTDPTDGSFVRWLVWTGNSVDAYKANFVQHQTLLVGPPTGPAPAVLQRVDGTAILSSGIDSVGLHTDNIYRVTMTGSSLVASLAFASSSPCAAGSANNFGSVNDAANGLAFIEEPTNGGYSIYSLPLAGGAATEIFEDSSGGGCAFIAGEAVSAGRVLLDVTDNTTGLGQVASIDEDGPANQAALVLAGDDLSSNAIVRYVVNGHAWVESRTFGPGAPFSETVMDGDGTVLVNFPNARIGNDTWAGYAPNGHAPGIDRATILLFSPNAITCTGGTLTAVDPASFLATPIFGVPADACRSIAFGWQPASMGGMQTAGGSVPIEVDPIAGQLFEILGPDPSGTFANLESLPGYPFF